MPGAGLDRTTRAVNISAERQALPAFTPATAETVGAAKRPSLRGSLRKKERSLRDLFGRPPLGGKTPSVAHLLDVRFALIRCRRHAPSVGASTQSAPQRC